ncbi:NAD(P)H-binding protein [Paenibacillus gyeongsangnamensis]|uniref:NAD(P)H-binding protein n=1 Tax=Paenibacillus gyeongsangnamensis TaxID=3388067 RepID=UPI003908265F
MTKEKQDDFVRQSGLDWTIVQPPTLTIGPAKGQYKHGSFHLPCWAEYHVPMWQLLLLMSWKIHVM